MRIALVALAVVSVASCASPRALADTPRSFVPWQPLPAAHQYVDPATSPPAAPAVPPGTPRCVAAQMEGVGLAGSAAAGNVDTPLLLRNKGTVSCYLRGFVDLTVIDRRGRVLANAAGAVGDVRTFFNDGNVQARINSTGSCGGSQSCCISANDEDFFHYWYCSRTLIQELGSLSPVRSIQ